MLIACIVVREGHGSEFSGEHPHALKFALPGTGIRNVYRSCIGSGQAVSGRDGKLTKSRIARAMRTVLRSIHGEHAANTFQ